MKQTSPVKPDESTAHEQSKLETRDLVLAHDTFKVIDGLCLNLAPGQVTAIVGPNGCGKSTLLNGLARVHAPSGGAVLLDGKDIHRLPSRDVARQIALLPQDNAAPDGLTVSDLIRFGRHPHQGLLRQWSAEDQRALERALAAADLHDLRDRALDTLSGGQRQRAWIAMAIAQATPLLLLDEPTSALDLGHQIEVFELIRELVNTGKTVVMVVHDLVSACRYADQLVAMQGGRVIACGTPEKVMTEDLVRTLYGVDCQIIQDPVSGSPLLVNVRRTAKADA
ncbi:ABC transporter ATP-binding protein [Marinobacter nanhaiticus D15-8W]|uniref:ABC transporter ATP-binding protein n=1 Tax=Marinobacter nanhaiticus D15-8W TaxID=626887 RepID=N6X299_9GAMM|nr:ABC transporter ATP-binding protein [Marinobacter nanhaiticus]ENO15173.1 ABC transporter ATP-binding protein [Marinobacter nanhaiticus D15-8W]BES69126.1 ABC transporter ATP-binding protein [Marinobacter nanhaiticus D15-8W]